MATKMAIEKGEERGKSMNAAALSEFSGNVSNAWSGFTRFLSDVRSEMRKVVTPSTAEVKTTTTVVIITVFVFGVFFMVSDWVFRAGVNTLLNKLGGMQ